MAELAELSLPEFKMVKAIYLGKKLGEDTSVFEQSVEHLADLPEQLARSGLVIDSRGLSDDEARAYVHDMLLEMKATDLADNGAFTTRRSPNSSLESGANLPSLHAGSETTSGRDGSDISAADAMSDLKLITVKEEELPDFDDAPAGDAVAEVPPTPIETIIARARTADMAGLRAVEPSMKRQCLRDDVQAVSIPEVPDEQMEEAEDRGF